MRQLVQRATLLFSQPSFLQAVQRERRNTLFSEHVWHDGTSTPEASIPVSVAVPSSPSLQPGGGCDLIAAVVVVAAVDLSAVASGLIPVVMADDVGSSLGPNLVSEERLDWGGGCSGGALWWWRSPGGRARLRRARRRRREGIVSPPSPSPDEEVALPLA